MALTVEDGSVVTGADSYVSVNDTKAYAAALGLSLPATDAAVEILLRKAFQYLETTFRARYKGAKLSSDQGTQWPRSGVEIDGFDFPSDEIPDELVEAQAQLACDAYTKALWTVGGGREVIRERVEGAVEVEYSPGGGSAPQAVFAQVEAMLAPLLDDGGGVELEVVRV